MFGEGRFDFLEFYTTPGSFLSVSELAVLKEIPIIVHAPHSQHHFNIFEIDDSKINLFKDLVLKTADFLDAKYIILHPGVGQSKDLFKKNLAKIADPRILIENMPKFIRLYDKNGNFIKDEHFGWSREQLLFIKKECGFNICFDFGHAIKSAVSQKIDYREFIEDLIKELQPSYFHFCDGDTSQEMDEHLNLTEGNFDLKWIKKILQQLAEEKDIDLVFEVPKQGDDLQNDLKNIDYFNRL